MREQDAQLVNHLDDPEDQRLVRVVALLEVRAHQHQGQVQGKGTGHDEHRRGVDVLEGDVAHKLCLNDGANVHEVGTQVMHVADSCARSDGGLDLARFLLGFAEKFFG